MLIDDNPSLLHVALGQAVTHTPVSGAPVDGFAIFNAPGSVKFGGEVLAIEPELRFVVADFPNVTRSSVFAIAGVSWRATQDPVALIDARESTVQLKRVP